MQIIEGSEHKPLGKLTKPIIKEIVNPSQKELLEKKIEDILKTLSEKQLSSLLNILSSNLFLTSFLTL